MKIIIAIDSWKGCLSSQEANEAAREGILEICPDADVLTLNVSDGGEGWMDAVLHLSGGEKTIVQAHDALMRPLLTEYIRKGDTAFIECAKVIGLTMLRKEELDPLHATSYGLGEVMVEAVRKGCRRIVLGLGGTATSDVGMGMLRAMEERFAEMDENEQVELAGNISYVIATDVRNPLCGKEGAAQVFAPQKGATPKDVELLERRARLLAARASRLMGRDCSCNPGAGAAGGLGYAFMQFLNARCCSGADNLLRMADFNNMLENADLIITGEGASDRQTLMGKLPYTVLEYAKAQHLPVWLVAGKVSDKTLLENAGFTQTVCVNPDDLPLENALQKNVATANIRSTVQQLFSTFRPSYG